MAQCLKSKTLFRSPTVYVGDVRCRPTDGGCSCEEVSHNDDFAFVRRGLFVKHVGRREYTANPNHLVFFNRDEPYRVSHPISGGDDCSAFSIRRDVVTSMLAEHDAAAPERRTPAFPRAEVTCDAALHLRHLRLMTDISSGELTDIAAEERVLGLTREVIDRSRVMVPRVRRSRRPKTNAAHRDRVEATKRILSDRYSTPTTLDEIAGAVHTSPYHLCRVFRDLTGRSIHAYRTDLRLRAALHRLTEGERDLTRLALDLGFADHGHFSNAFRRVFRMSPSAFRGMATRRGLREMSRNLQVS